MNHPTRWLALVLFMASTPVFGDEEMATAAIKKIQEATRSKDAGACKAAYKEGEFFKPDHAMAKRVSDAIAASVKKLHKKQPDVAAAGIAAMGVLGSPGATKKFSALLKPPSKVPYERVSLYLTAIRVAGQLREPDGMKALEKIVSSKHTELAVASTQSLAMFKGIERADRLKLIDRLIRTLSGFEKKRAKAKKHEQRMHYQQVTGNVIDCLAKLSGNSAATTSKDWGAWARAEKKRPAPSAATKN